MWQAQAMQVLAACHSNFIQNEMCWLMEQRYCPLLFFTTAASFIRGDWPDTFGAGVGSGFFFSVGLVAGFTFIVGAMTVRYLAVQIEQLQNESVSRCDPPVLSSF